MRKTIVLLASVVACMTTTQAASVAKSKSSFCASSKQKERVQKVLTLDEMRMSFSNHGGLVNGGVCWWHSRFQRNAAYLTIYRPELDRPSASEVADIVKRIRLGREIIEVPGYEDFNEFSRDNYEVIQKRLEGWQRHDGMVLQQWVVGLAGGSTIEPKKMKKNMDKLYKQVQKGDVVYQKLQIKGITAHAWLVIGMEETANGYDLFVIDSNSPSSTKRYTYTEGDDSFYHYYYGSFAPYTGKNRELKRLKRIVKKYCK